MVDRTCSGRRCRAVRYIESYELKVFMNALGTVDYTIENFERIMSLVEWDNGQKGFVFLSDIEIKAKGEAHAE